MMDVISLFTLPKCTWLVQQLLLVFLFFLLVRWFFYNIWAWQTVPLKSTESGDTFPRYLEFNKWKKPKAVGNTCLFFLFAQSLSASHHNHIHIRRNNFSFFSSSSLRHSVFYSATSIRAKTKAPRHWMLIENTCRWLIGNRLCEYERIDTHERY